MPPRRKSTPPPVAPQAYVHPESSSPARPEIGAQAHFKKTKAPGKFRYDSSLAPELVWDEGNPAREDAERLIAELSDHGLRIAELALQTASKERDAEIQRLEKAIREARRALATISGPFLNWTGKAERPSFDVPTLPLFIHERLSTKAILETLAGHKHDKQDNFLDALFGSEDRSLHDQALKAYEYPDKWVNRMVLGDSLVVMNSLLQFEQMAGKVQMVYIDPPYGVKFGSNFQPFIRRRDVSHNDDQDFTREPEMVQAYRDTWELGLHSYLTYLRDRLRVTRELLNDSGSVFVQISDVNVHHVRELMDDVFGSENFCAVIPFRKTSGASNPSGLTAIGSVCDYLLWYARDISRVKFKQLYVPAEFGRAFDQVFNWVEEPDGTRRQLSAEEKQNGTLTGRRFARADLSAQNNNQMYSYRFSGETYSPRARGWRTTEEGMKRLETMNRLVVSGNTLRYVQYADDFPVSPLQALWSDTGTGSFLEDKTYVVQTGTKVVERCMLMTTDPGDLVLDPTCGSGTTAYVAEQWGRRWITCDTSSPSNLS